MTARAHIHALLLSALGLVLAPPLAAQTAHPMPAQAARIASSPDFAQTTRLPGHLPSWVTPEADLGPAPAETPIRVTLLLARAPALQAAFDRLLADQLDPASPRFHAWLTPSQIGEQFGPAPADLDAITAWLASRGLTATVSPARTFIETTGPASVVASALSTTFHRFSLEGQPRLAAAQDPSIPAAFAPVIASIEGLAELPIHAFHSVQAAQPRSASLHPDDATLSPLGNTSSGLHYIFPGDFARIYNVTPTTQSGYDGSGVKVAVIGESRITATDITQLQTLAGLPPKPPNTILIPGSSDPGLVAGEEDESTVDLTRVLTVAPGVQADLVIAAQASGGVLAALQYNVDTLLDPIMNVSYGVCESQTAAADVRFYDTLFAQAAAEGISTFVASGDSAAAGCSRHSTAPTGAETRAVGNYLCSSSFVTCVGGTEFADAGRSAAFWASTNGPNYTSALGYIPEGAWNEPVPPDSPAGSPAAHQILGTGSGPSIFIPKPAWQTGPGVPADGARDTPDIAFTASSHDGFYACLAYLGPAFDCSRGGGAVFSGTSAAAPNMAAIAAILNQRLHQPQGNLNPTLYRLAVSTPAAFHDITPATSGVATCSIATASMCNNTLPSPNSLTGGLQGYPVTPGYDLVTGLGSLDVTTFLNAAVIPVSSPTQPPTVSLALTARPTTITLAQTAVFSATLAPSTGAPTGSIQFLANGNPLGAPISLSGLTAATAPMSFTTPGTYAITASYSGDTIFPAATSAPLAFIVTAVTQPIPPQPGLALAASPAALTLAAGAVTGNTSIVTLQPTGGLTGPATLACAIAFSSGTPTDPPTCTLSAPTLTLATGANATSTLTVLTTLPHAIPATQARRAPVSPSKAPSTIAFAALVLLFVPRRRLRRAASLTAILLISSSLIVLSGCGISGQYLPAPTAATPVGTSTGQYLVTVTATAAGLTRTSTLTLTVQ